MSAVAIKLQKRCRCRTTKACASLTTKLLPNLIQAYHISFRLISSYRLHFSLSIILARVTNVTRGPPPGNCSNDNICSCGAERGQPWRTSPGPPYSDTWSDSQCAGFSLLFCINKCIIGDSGAVPALPTRFISVGVVLFGQNSPRSDTPSFVVNRRRARFERHALFALQTCYYVVLVLYKN